MTAAATPFVFCGGVELRQALDRHAHDARELGARIAEVPADSLFFHVHGYFLRHRPFTTAYGNDFARWAAVELDDAALAERLAVVDPFAFPSLEALREDLVANVSDHVRDVAAPPRVEWERAFHFQQSVIVEVPLGVTATTLAEFRDALAGVDASAIYVHMVAARARRGRRSGDFALWFRTALERPELAERVERVDLFMATLERVRARLLALIDEELAERP